MVDDRNEGDSQRFGRRASVYDHFLELAHLVRVLGTSPETRVNDRSFTRGAGVVTQEAIQRRIAGIR
jgi:hypothetical protein